MPADGRLLRAVIVDDEQGGRDALRSALRRVDDVEVVAECDDGEHAIDVIRERQPDVVFLDVQMPEVDGFGVVAGVGPDKMPPVVMVTAHDEFALKAFEVHAVDYLLKPFTGQRLAVAVERVRAAIGRGDDAMRHQQAALAALLRATIGSDALGDSAVLASARGYATRLLVKHADRIRFVSVETVDYFEADGSYVRLHVGAEKHPVRRTLKDIQLQLDPNIFVRISRSTIVNVERIKEVQPWFNGDYVALLANGEQLRVSRMYRDDLLRPQF